MNNIKVITAPTSLKEFYSFKGKKIFLAGSIENGLAYFWQNSLIDLIKQTIPTVNILIFNPRREDWNSSLEQTIDNLDLNLQIEWELEAMDLADIIYMHIEKDTKSPITLLELGLYANSNKLIVNCPNGFYRKANIDIVCKKYNITNIENYDESIDNLILNINNL